MAAAFTLSNFTPRNSPMLWSVMVHACIALTAVVVMGWRGSNTDDRNDYVDFAYEEFDAPPAPAEAEQKVRSTPEPVTQEKVQTPQLDQPKELQDAQSDIAGTQKEAKPEANIGSNNNGNASATPYYRIKPKYPKAALTEGIEGWVMLQIDITETGEVDNIRVIDGEQRNMFQSEARRAVAQWKYKPFVNASGQPVRKADHHVRVDFNLSDTDS
jgi:periplasmic protein TonB